MLNYTEAEIRKLYQILAALKFNTERQTKVEIILRDFLLDPDKDINFDKKIIGDITKKDEKEFTEDFFRQNQHLLAITAPPRYVFEYINKKYYPYLKIFAKYYDINLKDLCKFIRVLAIVMSTKAEQIGFTGEVYQYKDKKECYEKLELVAKPDEIYIEKWSKIITLNKRDIQELKNILPLLNVNKVLSLFTFPIEQLSNPEIRLQEFPILYVNNKFIILKPDYLVRGLPQKFELLFKKCKEYLYKKGKYFEKIALDTLDKIPNSVLIRNLHYNGYELDGILKTDDYTWFVECSSHPPSIKALRGNFNRIKKDVKDSITKCINQANRSISNISHQNISPYVRNHRKIGIVVILEGSYPNISYPNLFSKDLEIGCKYKFWVINIFDLQIIMKQKEIRFLKDFLIWRTQKDMPIFSFDELDYWSYYFDIYRKNKENKKSFRQAKEKDIQIVYIGSRFNDKRYLNKIINDSSNNGNIIN